MTCGDCGSHDADDDELVVFEEPADEPRKWERVRARDRKADTSAQTLQPVIVHEFDVCAIGPIAGLLRRDQDHTSARLEMFDVLRYQGHAFIEPDVLEDVSNQQRVETPAFTDESSLEFRWGERAEPEGARRVHARFVGVDTHACTVKMSQIATDATADVEDKPWTKPTEIPPIRQLNAQVLPPTRYVTRLESPRIGLGQRALWRGCRWIGVESRDHDTG
jgi:hypothetical protein